MIIVFWNLNNKQCPGAVANLARSEDADVVILAEPPTSTTRIHEALNRSGQKPYHLVETVGERFTLFSAFSTRFIRTHKEGGRFSVFSLHRPELVDFTLITVHLSSKLYQRESSQSLQLTEISREIGELEESFGHRRTLLVGDFNMNPFEHGLVSAAGLNACMSRRISERGNRTVQGRSYPFFYNPMWSYAGDRSEGPPGNYYRDDAEDVTYYWNIFDQILVRPELMCSAEVGDIRVLASDGTNPLVSASGIPNKRDYSDHLPLAFSLAPIS